MDKQSLENKIILNIKQVHDPEIPVNVYDLGLIYKIDISDDAKVEIDMTLTNPNCPEAGPLLDMVNSMVVGSPEVSDVKVNLVFEPIWDQSMMTEDAKLELGLL